MIIYGRLYSDGNVIYSLFQKSAECVPIECKLAVYAVYVCNHSGTRLTSLYEDRRRAEEHIKKSLPEGCSWSIQLTPVF